MRVAIDGLSVTAKPSGAIDFRSSEGVSVVASIDNLNGQIDVRHVDRRRIANAALGVKDWTIDPTFTWQTGTQLMTGGSVYYTAIGLAEGDVVTNIIVPVSTQGSGVTLSKAGLYDSALTLLASSADQGTAWQSTGKKVCALASPYTVTSTGLYYLAVIATASTTLPTLIRGTNNATGNAVIGSGPKPAFDEPSQSDLPATGSSASLTATVTVCVGWS